MHVSVAEVEIDCNDVFAETGEYDGEIRRYETFPDAAFSAADSPDMPARGNNCFTPRLLPERVQSL